MVLLRWLRYVVSVPILMLLSGLAAAGPTLWVLLILKGQEYRLAGTVAVLTLITWWMFGPSATRSALIRLSRSNPAIADEALARDVAAELSAAGGGRAPTVWWGPFALPGPVPLQGVRSTFVLVPPDRADAAQAAAAVRQDRATGAARLAPLALVPPSLLASWGYVVQLSTTAVRPGSMSLAERFFSLAFLPLLPFGLVGWVQAWLVVQVARLFMPRRITRAMLALDPGSDGTGVPGWATFARLRRWLPRRDVGGRRERQGGTCLTGPVRLARGAYQDWLSGLVLATVGVLPLFMGTYIGVGSFVGERVAWPWEETPVTGEVVALESVGEAGGGGLLGRLGYDITSERSPTVRTAQGELEAGPMGTQQVAVGDRITVVPGDYHGAEARWAATSVAYAVTMSGFWVGLAVVVRMTDPGFFGMVVRRHVRMLEHDQRGALGLPRGRRRPKPLLGIDLSF